MIFHFHGTVLPIGYTLTVPPSEPIVWQIIGSDDTESYDIEIIDSAVHVTCDISNFKDTDISFVRNKAFNLARARVEIVAFRLGLGLGISLDRLVDENGIETILLPKQDGVEDMFHPEFKEEVIFLFLASDESILMAFNDLVSSLNFPYYAHVNCARVIDALRHHMFPNFSEKDGWKAMQEALVVSEASLISLSHLSREGRHGKRVWKDPDLTGSSLYRTWKIMNRFLIYKHNGEKPLDPNTFQLIEI